MGDVAEAGSFMDFLKAIGNSIAHPQKKSKARTKSTKQPGSKDVASAKPTLSPSSRPPDEDNVRAASAAPEANAEKPMFRTPFRFQENRVLSSARSRPSQ